MTAKSMMCAVALLLLGSVTVLASGTDLGVRPHALLSLPGQVGPDLITASDAPAVGDLVGQWDAAIAKPKGATKFPRNTFEIGLMTGAVGLRADLASGSRPGYVFNLSPGLGYFVAPRLELLATFSILAYMTRYSGINDSVGITVGARYHLEFGQPVIPYFGMAMGITFFIASTGSPSRESFVMNIPFGVLYQIYKGVFADVGMQINVNEPLNGGGVSTGNITLLRVGIRIFLSRG